MPCAEAVTTNYDRLFEQAINSVDYGTLSCCRGRMLWTDRKASTDALEFTKRGLEDAINFNDCLSK